MISSKPILNPDGTFKIVFNPNNFVEDSIANFAQLTKNNLFVGNNTFNNINAIGNVLSTNITALSNQVDANVIQIQANTDAIDALEATNIIPSAGTISANTTYANFTTMPRNILADSTLGAYTVTLPNPTASETGYRYRFRNGYSGTSVPGANVTLQTPSGSRFRTTGNANVSTCVILPDKVCEIVVHGNVYYCNFY